MYNAIKGDNTWEELNKHLTNNVLLRIDYIPLPDEKVYKINNLLARKILIENKMFDVVKQIFVRNIDIQVNDPSIQDFNEFINIKERSKIKSYEYYKENNGSIEIKLSFNRQFCSIDMNEIIKYYNYESYRDIFLNVLSILSEQDIIINRFGLKKFNDFFIKKDANLNEYVKDKYFNLNYEDLVRKYG